MRDGEAINRRASQIGFFIDHDTEVILGGQWLDVCVQSTFKKMLQLPNVSQVKIDKKATRESHLQTMQWRDYIPVIQGEPYTWSDDADYYYIDKI